MRIIRSGLTLPRRCEQSPIRVFSSKMNRSRHILAVLAVTAALCADQLASAAPIPKTPVAEIAARLVVRLSESFPKTVSCDVRPEIRPQRFETPLAATPTPVAEAIIAHQTTSPFQFRLPPPSL